MLKRGHEIPTIDVVLVTVKPYNQENEIALDTSSQIQVNPQSETSDAIKLIVKDRLIAQKPSGTTITGNTITLTDNVFNAELVKILQGGTIKYWTDKDHTASGEEDTGNGLAGYTPPVVGSREKGEPFMLCAYSAIYDAAGLIIGYEKISYPNCQGVPVAFSSQDGAFRAPEYTINSAPKNAEAPYDISFLDPDKLPALPTLNDTNADNSGEEGTETL